VQNVPDAHAHDILPVPNRASSGHATSGSSTTKKEIKKEKLKKNLIY
jgi:hypothetical protein